jgi:tetratricopeptide (TPR) repeat protein
MNDQSRLARLLPLLESDPGNLTLLADAAETALDEGRPEVAAELIDGYSGDEALPPSATNLRGLAAMRLGDFAGAAETFETMMAGGVDDPTVRFNLAWAKAMTKDEEGALGLLDDSLSEERADAAMLQVQLLHARGDFDEAAERARRYVDLHPGHRGLMAATSVLALDVEDAALAERCAAAAGDHPDALATLGTLALVEDRGAEATELFERALAANSGVPRAWIGRGLARLVSGENELASDDLDRGAEMFGDHLGSWIAAGWAWFVRNDLGAARARFERALALDPTFAESHGSLAVVDLLEGDVEGARKGADVALRLDRNCFSAALAQTLLAAGSGDRESARRIFDLAANRPIDASGRTIAQALAKVAL